MIEEETARLQNLIFPPSKEVLNYLESVGSTPISTGARAAELLKRPNITYEGMKEIDRGRPDIPDDVAEQVEISIKYEGYINRQIKQAEQFRKLESKKLPEDIDYSKIDGLRIEARQKLEKIKPSSLGQASRISGVNPADIAVLMVYLKK